MTSYFLAEAADTDLDEIFEYSYRQWGPEQAFKYLEQLHECAEALASGRIRFKQLPGLLPNLRMMRCQHHYVFCEARKDGPSAILAIFHEQMDLMTRIAERLGR